MRKHVVNCVIEGNNEDVKELMQNLMNQSQIQYLEKILQSSHMSKEEKIYIIDEIIEKCKK